MMSARDYANLGALFMPGLGDTILVAAFLKGATCTVLQRGLESFRSALLGWWQPVRTGLATLPM